MIKQTEVLGGKWYYLKLDIAKYFYRIYHDKLMEILERKIKDPDMLELLNVNLAFESFRIMSGGGQGTTKIIR